MLKTELIFPGFIFNKNGDFLYEILCKFKIFNSTNIIAGNNLRHSFGGIHAWTGVFLFGIYTIIDTVTKDIHLRAEKDEAGNSYGIKLFQYLVMYVMLPVFIAIQAAVAWRLYQYTSGVQLEALYFGGIAYQNGISGLNLVGAVISAALWAGLGIIYGHELSHNKRRLPSLRLINGS